MKKNLLFIFCFFTFGLTAQIPTYIPTNGLVGWWPFNGNANDESGNGNNLTQSGTVSYEIDRNNKNLSCIKTYGAANDYLYKNNVNLPVGNSNRTVSVWYKILQQSNGPNIFTQWEVGNSCYSSFGIFGSFDNVYFWGRCTDKMQGYSAIDNNWINIIIVYENNYLKIFKNGIQLNTNNNSYFNYTSSLNTSSNQLLIGGRPNNPDPIFPSSFNGFIDDIGVWNRVLTQQEITALYQGCTTPTATITPQSNTNFCQGNNVVLNATTGTNYTYEWYNNGTLISGAATNSYAATTAGNYTVKVIDGSCNATSSATTLTLIDTVTWTGNVDNDWHKPCNWSPEVVPECCNSVKIPFTPISPVVSGVGKAKNVTLYSTSGATLTVNNGANLQIETCPVNKTENSCPTLPVISTTAISSITQTSAVSGGNITYSGASSITARGVCWSTTASPTVANSKTTDGSGIGTYTSNLTGLTAGTTYYVRAYATNASGTSYGNEVSFIALNPQPAYPLGSVFCNGTPTLVVDVTNPTTGKTWMDRNLGASQAATSSTDPLAYGDLYQWGRGSDGHQCRNSSTTSVLSSTDQPGHGNFILAPNSPLDWRSPQNTNLWQGTNGVNNPCPSGYRIPTKIELINETNNWNSNNYIDDAFISILKFSIGGWRGNSVNLHSGAGLYWSSDLSQSNFVGQSKHLSFSNSTKVISDNERSSGMSVRCIKN